MKKVFVFLLVFVLLLNLFSFVYAQDYALFSGKFYELKQGEEKIEFTGMESRRRDWTELAKNFQYELLDRIFHKKEIADYVRKFIDDIKKGRY